MLPVLSFWFVLSLNLNNDAKDLTSTQNCYDLERITAHLTANENDRETCRSFLHERQQKNELLLAESEWKQNHFNYQESLDILERIKPVDDRQRSKTKIAIGIDLYHLHRYAEAVSNLKFALVIPARKIDQIRIYFYLIKSLEYLDQKDEVAVFYRQFNQAFPRSPELSLLAQFLWMRGYRFE